MRTIDKFFWLTVTIIDGVILAAWTFWGAPHLVEENGVLENLQALVIAAALLVYLLAFHDGSRATRPLAVLFAFVCFCFFFREVDFRVLDVPGWVVNVTSGYIRDLLFLGLLALLLIFLYWRRDSLPGFFRFLCSRLSVPLYLCAALLILGDVLEGGGLLRVAPTKFWEEFAEVNAYFALFMAALCFWRWCRTEPLKWVAGHHVWQVADSRAPLRLAADPQDDR